MTARTDETGLGARILVVDDDENLRLILGDRLRAMGCEVSEAGSLAQARRQLAQESFQLLFLDVFLPDQQEMDGLREVQERDPTLPVIVMTAHGTIDLAVAAMRAGAYDFLTKPLDFRHLAVMVERALENSQLRSEVDYLRRATDAPHSEIVGQQTGLAEVMALVRKVATVDAPVLLRGETGTGKEVIARAIHRQSPRCRRPFVVANCAAIPRELMESEMFGHVRGAFTGAVADHAGFFETAGRGTLLLDEIGDLNLDLQAKILRVLEDGSFRKVGSSTMLRNRARIIASTHQPLEELMAESRFREDLFYRLNVLLITLPPLRERREDIPALARRFLRQARGGRPEPALREDALALLKDHPWWGNLRELRNCMEQAALVVTGPEIAANDLLPLLHRRTARPEADLVRPLDQIEYDAIIAALDRFGGNRTRAAEALGIGRRTLQNKLKLYGLVREDAAGE
jgi:two-component system response regulator AtoC